MVVIVDACADHGIKIASATRTMRAGASRQEIFDFLKCRVVIFFVSIFGLGWIVDCIDCNPVPRGTGNHLHEAL
jgi:hypothetical protein